MTPIYKREYFIVHAIVTNSEIYRPLVSAIVACGIFIGVNNSYEGSVENLTEHITRVNCSCAVRVLST